jgi:hypothetical protein
MVASSGGFVIADGDLSACLPESSATAAEALGRLLISRLSLPDPDRAIKTDAGAGRPLSAALSADASIVTHAPLGTVSSTRANLIP